MQLKYRIVLFLFVGVGFYFSLPTPLFQTPKTTLLLDNQGELLSARIATDEQWRFPKIDVIPSKIETCILLFEDEYFYYHPGVNPISIGRALWQNLASGKIKSGGSTLSMQVIRLSRNNPSRTYLEKLWELFLAIRLEFSYTKREILEYYTSNAPYGGNVVGLETASWRYFRRSPQYLSWSESALLAVLPNSPSLIHLGKNRKKLRKKRDRLLLKLYRKNVLDSLTYSLSILEAIPAQPKPLPNHAFHLLSQAINAGKEGQRITTTLDRDLQLKVSASINRYVKRLTQNEVHNACALVVSLKDQHVLAYVGNAQTDKTRAPYVDLIQAPRSSGSILKPLLYGRALEKGMLHNRSLLRDVPITIDQFAPKNFDGEFEGVVPAGQALSRSLNVPATLLLRDYGIAPFHRDLNQFGLTTINRPADHYGLTLILGGAEVKLLDLARFYAFQAQQLNDIQTPHTLRFWQNAPQNPAPSSTIDVGAWWLITEALTEVQRPGINMDWRNYTSSRKVAWKTGTSHGFRDAWAIGYDRNYLVAVWVGNADGEGRPGLTGVSAAGPLMFNIFQYLPKSKWFEKPEFNLKSQTLCAQSGYLATPNCPQTEADFPAEAYLNTTCTYHQRVLVNNQNKRVFRDCAQGRVKDTTIFQLDPVAGYYYRKKHRSDYVPLSLAESCSKTVPKRLGIIYPTANAQLIIPTNFAGKQEQVLFKAHHTETDQTLFWHLDDTYLGTTREEHEWSTHLTPGKHRLLILDENGNRATRTFMVYVDRL